MKNPKPKERPAYTAACTWYHFLNNLGFRARSATPTTFIRFAANQSLISDLKLEAAPSPAEQKADQKSNHWGMWTVAALVVCYETAAAVAMSYETAKFLEAAAPAEILIRESGM